MEGSGQRSDMKNVPQLLHQASDAEENEASRHFAISLFAELAKAHKQAIVPYIPRMMASIVRSLPFSADTQQLHQACAKAVASVARYTVDPSRSYDSNQQILSNLCSPLIPVLASKLDSAAAGAAVCLQALVESEKWKFAHPDLQGRICSKATAALEDRGAHSVAVLHLVKSLAKLSRDASQRHAAEWVRIGLQVLQENLGTAGSWQHRVAAAQLVAVILKMGEPDKLGLDLHATTKILEAFLTDKVNIVQIAVAEALETLKATALENRVLCQLPDSTCEGKRKNSDTEESGLSGSFSPKSVTSSHEALPSMASSMINVGMGLKTSQHQPRDSLFLSSHASLGRPVPSRLRGNAPATMPRRVLSEIPASGKLLHNSEVSSCPSKPLRRSFVDVQSKVSSYLMQEKLLINSEKSIQREFNQIHDGGGKTSLPTRELAEGCQNCSDVNGPRVLSKEVGESDNQFACMDHLGGKVDSEILPEHDDCVEEVMNRMPVNCRRGCMDDNCVHDMRNSGCSGDLVSEKDIRDDASNERTAARDIGGHVQVEQPRSLAEEFTFRPPSRLLESLQPTRSPEQTGKSCRECTDSDAHLSKEADGNGSDVPASCESVESRVEASGSENTHETTADASCSSASKDLGSTGNRTFKLGARMDGWSFPQPNEDSKLSWSVRRTDWETHTSREEWPSLRVHSDSVAERLRRRRNGSLQRSSKKGSLQRRSTELLGGHSMPSASRPAGSKLRGMAGHRSEVSGARSEGSKRRICAGTLLGFATAVLVLIVAALAMHRLNQAFNSHSLVPT